MKKLTLTLLLLCSIGMIKAQQILPPVLGKSETEVITEIKKNYKSLEFYTRDELAESTVLIYLSKSKDLDALSVAISFKEDRCYEYVFIMPKSNFSALVESISSNKYFKKVPDEALTWTDQYQKLKISTKDSYVTVSHTRYYGPVE